MHEQNLAIVKGLVSVAWADGKIAAEETELIDGLLQAFKATPSEAHEIRRFAERPRTLDDVPLTDLSAEDRRLLLHYAVLVTFVDRVQSESEREFLQRLVVRLRLRSTRPIELCKLQNPRRCHSLICWIHQTINSTNFYAV